MLSFVFCAYPYTSKSLQICQELKTKSVPSCSSLSTRCLWDFIQLFTHSSLKDLYSYESMQTRHMAGPLTSLQRASSSCLFSSFFQPSSVLWCTLLLASTTVSKTLASFCWCSCALSVVELQWVSSWDVCFKPYRQQCS